jgi:hypothetical protein
VGRVLLGTTTQDLFNLKPTAAGGIASVLGGSRNLWTVVEKTHYYAAVRPPAVLTLLQAARPRGLR